MVIVKGGNTIFLWSGKGWQRFMKNSKNNRFRCINNWNFKHHKFSSRLSGNVTTTGTMNITSGDIIDKLDSKPSISGSEGILNRTASTAANVKTLVEAFNQVQLV